MTKTTCAVLFVLLGLASGLVAADPKSADKGKTDPPGVPLEAILTSKKASYQLNLNGKAADEVRKMIDAGDAPPPVAVDLSLEIRNTGDKDIRIRMAGTTTILDLDLQGPAAASAARMGLAADRPVVAPMTITLEPGKSQTIPITSLSFGFRDSHSAYWLAPGKYTLVASYRTTVSPAPPSAEAADEGFGAATVSSAPLTITVEGK